MFRVRSRIAVSHPTGSKLVLQSSPGRRILFGVIGLLLLVALLLSVDWQLDFRRDSIVGTLFYLLLTVTCLAVAAWGTSVVFDSEQKEIAFIRRIAGLEVGRQQIDSQTVQGVIIEGVRFLKEAERPQPGLLNSRFRTYVDRRNNYYKLYLDLGERKRFLEDSTELSELDAAAAEISQFLQVTLRREEI